MQHGQPILGGRYILRRSVLTNSRNEPEVWEAVDSLDNPCLVKAWRYSGDQPDDVYRAQWDRELRTLFRISSSPGSEAHLVVLRDAGIDRENKQLIMVLASPGFSTLDSLLAERAKTVWLRDLANHVTRLAVWRAVRSLALGLQQLHEQHMLHRDISARAVFVQPQLGPESLRLGGFELTVRVGSNRETRTADTLVSPPELQTEEIATHTFESDWYLFGALLVTLFVGHGTVHETSSKHNALVDRIQSDLKLHEMERDFILSLLSHDPKSRLSRGYQVVQGIEDIVIRLGQPVQMDAGAYLALVVVLGGTSPLTSAIIEQDETINALAIESQRLFIENDLRKPKIVRPPGVGSESYLLQGNRLVYEILEEKEGSSSLPGRWNIAFCPHPKQITYSTGDDDQIDLDRVPIKVFPVSSWKKNPTIVQSNSTSWKPYLPVYDPTLAAQQRQVRFHDFFRITNQLELLFRDAEVFGYQIVGEPPRAPVQEIVIQEIDRTRPFFKHARLQGGLVAFLKSQMEEKKRGFDQVYLGPEESLFIGRNVDEPEFWKIKAIDDGGAITLQRGGLNHPNPPKRGFIRAFGMFGQLPLIDRRKRAIERLGEHTYLLQALQFPDTRFIDSGDSSAMGSIDRSKVDDAKQDALQHIWRSRPIFTLQGPPGTGKTTLVAHLLGAIFKDDPVAQVLVTAQAHSAVDVLKKKVTSEIFRGVKEEELPLSIRLSKKGNRDEEEINDPDTIRNVTLRVLKRSEQSVTTTNPVAAEWLTVAKEAAQAILGGVSSEDAEDLLELVRRSANVTYSTTTGGGLEELANMTQSFDWSIIEEAGKAHGFDLALPLQTGHRWLLIGDQNQLPPYRYEDFLKCLNSLEDAMEFLLQLPEGAGNLVDRALIFSWRGLTSEEASEREILWKTWLRFFKNLFDTCYQRIPREEGRAVLASMLDRQHRMHPTIAGLISAAYYETPIVSMTVDDAGIPKPSVTHPFTTPASLPGKALVWLDVPRTTSRTGRAQERIEGMETSDIEVRAVLAFLNSLRTNRPLTEPLKLAVLSPYRKQVARLRRELRRFYENPPAWVLPISQGESHASTVDAYQGNQADIVIVSLVRNNAMPRGEGLGFLKFAERMNVLFSRAEQLLILVGSWEFFQHQLVEAPAVRGQHLGHWKLAMQYIEKRINDKNALRLPAAGITGQ